VSDTNTKVQSQTDRLISVLRTAVKMRDAQKAYFKGRFSSERLDLLRIAKCLESEFDDKVQHLILDGNPETNRVAKLLNDGSMIDN